MTRKNIIYWLGLVCCILAGPLVAEDKVITQKDKTFSAPEITVKIGESVVFKNDDDVNHNVYSTTKGNEFNLKTQAPGASASVPFKAEGRVEVSCAFHPKMKMTVHVKK